MSKRTNTIDKMSRPIGTEMEHRTRKEHGFDDLESKLPDLRITPFDRRPTLQQKLLSYLGPWNPLPQNITKNDTVWILDNTAYRSASGEWQAEFVVAVFDQDTGGEVSKIVADVAEKVGLGRGDKQEETVRQRITPFVQAILPGRVVKIDVGRVKQIKTSPGGSNAISSDLRFVPQGKDGQVVTSTALVPKGADGILQSKTVYAEPEGWAVVSDIDDTIKITQTSDPIGILRSTFVSDPTPIEGMPEFYKYIQELISPTAPFFYLSASPYNLYGFLSGFRQKFYPQGTMILRDASWMNLSGLLSNLTLGTEKYKSERCEKINGWIPKRNMILIGDSTQSDPEAYGETYRKYPDWVKIILIRKVTDIAAVGIEAKNEPGRFEKAFKDVPKENWYLFEDPKECYDIVKAVVAKHA